MCQRAPQRAAAASLTLPVSDTPRLGKLPTGSRLAELRAGLLYVADQSGSHGGTEARRGGGRRVAELRGLVLMLELVVLGADSGWLGQDAESHCTGSLSESPRDPHRTSPPALLRASVSP